MSEPRDDFTYINKTYGLNVRIGQRIEFDTGTGFKFQGTVRESDGAYVRIQLDGEKRIGQYHPVWGLKYLD